MYLMKFRQLFSMRMKMISDYIELALRAAGENNPLKITKRNISQLTSVNLSSYSTVIISASGECKRSRTAESLC
jgi:hypothetical protein